ncbi:MAG: MMPL family transporter [Ktedonobacteraceae bacterium]
MLKWFGRFIYRMRWTAICVVLLLIALVATYSIGVFSSFKSLSVGDPNSASEQARTIFNTQLSKGSANLILLMSSDTLQVTDPTFQAEVTNILQRITTHPGVALVASYYSTKSTDLISHDGRSTIVLLHLSGQPIQQENYYVAVKPLITSSVLHIMQGGLTVAGLQLDNQISTDLVYAEEISLPILLVLLFIIFNGVIAAFIPLLIGIVAIFGSFALLRVLASFTDISNFAVEVVAFIGLGLAIDYSLIMLTRFREELRPDLHDVQGALQRTMASAGRTVLFSGLTVFTSLLGLLLFPEALIRSIGLACVCAAVAALLTSLVLLPIFLAILGRRVNALSLQRLFKRRRSPRLEEQRGFWYWLAHSVMKHPIPVLVVTIAFLLTLASPFLRASFSIPDQRSLPQGASARLLVDQLQKDFPDQTNASITIAVRTQGDALSSENLDKLNTYVQQIKNIQGVDQVQSLVTIQPSLTLADYQQLYAHPSANPQLMAAAAFLTQGNISEVTIATNVADFSTTAENIVRQLRTIAAPAGLTAFVGGNTAQQMDLTASMSNVIPLALTVMAVMIFILLFLMTGSIILPLKAIVLNLLSLTATLGALVWVFQEGHLHELLGFQPIGSLDIQITVLIFAIAFGLSMDYEVFLLSRIKEHFDLLGDNQEAVAQGLQRMGWLITSAALLMAVVIGAFATSRIIFIQELGVGVALAVLMDATFVRGLLVPAMMRLLGSLNWWTPPFLRPLWKRIRLVEVESAERESANNTPQLDEKVQSSI